MTTAKCAWLVNHQDGTQSECGRNVSKKHGSPDRCIKHINSGRMKGLEKKEQRKSAPARPAPQFAFTEEELGMEQPPATFDEEQLINELTDPQNAIPPACEEGLHEDFPRESAPQKEAEPKVERIVLPEEPPDVGEEEALEPPAGSKPSCSTAGEKAVGDFVEEMKPKSEKLKKAKVIEAYSRIPTLQQMLPYEKVAELNGNDQLEAVRSVMQGLNADLLVKIGWVISVNAVEDVGCAVGLAMQGYKQNLSVYQTEIDQALYLLSFQLGDNVLEYAEPHYILAGILIGTALQTISANTASQSKRAKNETMQPKYAE